MDKINLILDNISNNISQALARFNDGELIGIQQIGATVARGAQTVDHTLSSKLKEAIQYKQINYWVGLPCSVCYPQHSRLAQTLIDRSYPHLTHAVVITNRNLKLVTEELPKRLNNKTIKWVSGEDQNIKGLEKVGINISEHLKVPTINAWKSYDSIKSYTNFQPGEVILCSCGPLSRVLVREWFEKYPSTTFLDIGCLFDPYTRDKWMRVHLGTLPECKECN